MVRQESYGGRGPTLMTVGWVESMIGVLLCLLRLYGASKKAGHIRMDFLFIALAVIFGIGAHAAYTVSILHGMGNRIQKLTIDEIFASLHWIWISIFIGTVAIIFAKWAIIALILEVQGPNAKKRKYFLLFLGGLLAVSGLVQIPLSYWQCEPVERLWNPTIPGVCPRQLIAARWSYWQGALAALSDFILALWPISIAWNLQTTFKVKLGFCGLMAGGILPSVASLVRSVLLPRLIGSKDITWDFAIFMIWSATELWSVIILGSIPPLRPLFLHFFSKVGTTVSSGTRGARAKYGRGSANDAKLTRSTTTTATTITATTTNAGTKINTLNNSNSNDIGAQKGLQLQMLDKKGIHTSTRLVGPPGASSSMENLTCNDNDRGILVQHDYVIETSMRSGDEEEGGSWYDGVGGSP